MKLHHTFLPAAALAIAATPVLAQQQPDAGRLLQETTQTLPRPAQNPGVAIDILKPADMQMPGGLQVKIDSIRIDGNSRIPQAQLLDALGPVSGKTYDFAGLSALAAKLTAYYQAQGYPFARVYLPQQDLAGGQLQLHVLEGRYGRVTAHGEPAFIEGAQGFLSHLPVGAIMESPDLERVTLILDDQPGVRTRPVVRPGREVGTGDLLVEVQRDHRYKGEVGIDDYGNRYTGRVRAHANLDIDSPFRLGDQIALQSLYTQERMWFGSLAYAAPLGYSGLRGRVGYAHTYYTLGGSFSGLGANGTADIASLGLSYPLIRSQARNVTLSAGLDHKRLHDRQDTTATSSEKSSDTLPLALSFDVRDGFLRAGITYGALTWTPGRLHLDDTLAAIDQTTARSAGRFSKINLDVARIQSVSEHVDVYGRMSAQWAGGNLDSSEKFGLGGINGVRAYPSGEGYGDSGWLAQLELRYAAGSCMPYLFYDAGRVTTNRDPWSAVANNHRSVAGAGAGVRGTYGDWTGNLTLAWKTRGGAALSDPHDERPVVWASAQYRF
ncbi:ShlB/FhaC/HecB family hemolysin secretion/activation protein [Noviherbaspirillum pedocola]|uniref:ShlB/FhaC/HecB family hemolysin secretion/activation protein n=1 Tax=Noviherbaspirillum pedocola TaxID=2801341 RepID=A0A934SWZ7_9BURK|nr:ShlB/FhaC/HecB family hemolysin secretion/activation protein [Noviherbaspirillum pedocola]MBK4738105.1 ShlB/FhaC/HecB family hemolysin secretion/activation protein [Noviherbaspirillum pedocola]